MFASVYTDEKGLNRIVLPTGEDVPHLLSTNTECKVDAIPTCTFSLVVNIVSTKEEALKKYSESEF